MKITDFILVIENKRGNEINSFMDIIDFLDFLEKDCWLSWKELAEDMAMLGRTLGEKEKWTESQVAADKKLFLRYCTDINQMETFLRGGYNMDKGWRFDWESCSKECLDYLKVQGVKTDSRVRKNVLHYEEKIAGREMEEMSVRAELKYLKEKKAGVPQNPMPGTENIR